MSLGFLTPLPTAANPARGPFLDAALAAGATTVVRGGWEVIDNFGDPAAEAVALRESVGFADRSELTKLELQFAAADAPEFAPSTAVRTESGWSCPIRPTRHLLLGPSSPADAADGPKTEAGVEFSAHRPRVCDVTAAYSALTIAGPRARDAFAQFCALDLREASLPVGGFRPGSVARTPGFVLREGPESFLMLTGAAYGQYVWETVAAAVAALGGRPVGAAALPALDLEATDA
jgi:heterotetrameric sarcosine oxidase gamma subunit